MIEKPKRSRRPGRTPGSRRAARAVALGLLRGVLHGGRTLDLLFETDEGLRELDGRDRGLARMMALTCLRRLGALDLMIAQCLDRPPPPKARAAMDLTRLGLTQILYMDIPDHAAVDETVSLAQSIGAGPYKSMINAILRRATRERDSLLDLAAQPGACLPPWLFRRWRKTFGLQRAGAIAAALPKPAPLDISVKGDLQTWSRRLDARILPTGSLRLKATGNVTDLEGFADGAWWVQDAAAAIPPRLFGDPRGRTVIDLCAAPGGKTASLAAQGAKVVAVDRSESRMKRLRENMDRLGLDVESDIVDGGDFVRGEKVDGVLVDAPCSATGTLRRHPDAAWLKKPRDIERLVRTQTRLIARGASLLKPGGLLIYCVCSLEPEEGAERVRAALADSSLGLARHPVASGDLPGIESFLTNEGHIMTLPSFWPEIGGLDGFFAARFVKS